MDEWLSYSLHDLLIFSPESYFRLFERSNQAFWPFQLPLIALTLLMLYLVTTRSVRAGIFISLILSVFWLLSGWWFIEQYYSEINTIADWYLLLFIVEALLLFIYSFFVALRKTAHVPVKDSLLGLGLGIAAYALFIHPLLVMLSGRGWRAVELIGIAPDATVIATVGFILAMGGSRLRHGLLLIPIIWLFITGFTYSTFN